MLLFQEYFKASRFSSLGSDYGSFVVTDPLSSVYWVHINNRMLQRINIDRDILSQSDALCYLSGNEMNPLNKPFSMLYAGHQFGRFVPQLGDGRAVSLGDISTSDGLLEVQLKGAGQTPYSRQADGRAVLRSSIREYLCSAAMEGLGIPTTSALGIIGSDDEVYREQIETAAVVTRLAPSFIRFGSFEVFYHRQQYHLLKPLADFIIDHHFPSLHEEENPYLCLLETVAKKTAELVAKWQLVGFCHGVMNTDNMSVLGLTIDYGPFGFLDAYDPNYICNHSDHHGRYAYDQQPPISLWNVTCLAQAMLPLIDEKDKNNALSLTKKVLEEYRPYYEQCYREGMNRKLGLIEQHSGDAELHDQLLDIMAKNGADFTRVFRALGSFEVNGEAIQSEAAAEFLDRDMFVTWSKRYVARLQQQLLSEEDRQRTMNQVNPKYILRNYLAQQAIDAAKNKDYSEIDRLMTILEKPFDEHPEYEQYASLPPSWANELSVSCSS